MVPPAQSVTGALLETLVAQGVQEAQEPLGRRARSVCLDHPVRLARKEPQATPVLLDKDLSARLASLDQMEIEELRDHQVGFLINKHIHSICALINVT